MQGGKLLRDLTVYPEGAAPKDPNEDDALAEMHTEALTDSICSIVIDVARDCTPIKAVGIALPGMVRNGVVEEAPNLPQLKGARLSELVGARLRSRGFEVRVALINDADAMAAGLAAEKGKLEHMVRVWTLGTGIGYGVYPFCEGVWEAGHSVVTLDEKENFCGCGGRGHMEGIMGHRAMRLRFLDMEPEEVFEAANRREKPDPRCFEFKQLWHKALAAATAAAIHQAGPGKFYITGYNVRFLELNILRQYLHEMVKMSPLQSYSVEIVPDDQRTRVLGAAVAAEASRGARLGPSAPTPERLSSNEAAVLLCSSKCTRTGIQSCADDRGFRLRATVYGCYSVPVALSHEVSKPMATATLPEISTASTATLDYKVADISLADWGRKEITIAEQEMPRADVDPPQIRGRQTAAGRAHHGLPAHDDPDGCADRDASGVGCDGALGELQYFLHAGSRGGGDRGFRRSGICLERRVTGGVLVVHGPGIRA